MKNLARFLFFVILGCHLIGCAGTPNFPLPWASQDTSKSSFERELSLARLSERHGQAKKASQVYHSILAKDPSNVIANHRLAVIAARKRQYDQAMQHFVKAEKAAPPNAELLSDIGYVLYLQNDLARAESKLRQAVALDPQHQAAHNNLGLVLGELGRTEQSLAEFRQAVGEADAQTNLAYVQAKRGNLDKAIATYHRALENGLPVAPSG